MKRTKYTKQPLKVIPDAIEPRRVAPRQTRREAGLALPIGERDLQAVRSVMHEWLVPRLVEDFLRERGIELKHTRMSVNQ